MRRAEDLAGVDHAQVVPEPGAPELPAGGEGQDDKGRDGRHRDPTQSTTARGPVGRSALGFDKGAWSHDRFLSNEVSDEQSIIVEFRPQRSIRRRPNENRPRPEIEARPAFVAVGHEA